MEGKELQDKINGTIWSACDTLRSSIPGGNYKDYALVMLFVKYLSDTYKEEKEKLQQNLLSLDSAEACGSLDATWEELQGFSAVVDSGNLEATQRLLHSLVDKIVVLNNNVTIYWAFC